jgi:spermidine synthase
VQVLRHARAWDLGLRSGLPAFLLGFLATAFQIYLLREFAVHFYGNELTFGFVLAAWLLWGGIGSLLGPKLELRPDHLPQLYAVTIGLFFSSLVLLRFSHRLLGTLPGELTGHVPALAFSLALAFFVSFPLGLAFVLNAALLKGNAPRVYLLESLGAAVAGLTVHLLLIPRFSNWEGAALVAAAAMLAFFFALRPPKAWPLFLGTLAAASLFAAIDFPSLRSAWKPFNLVEAEDTPYGKLQILQTGDQFSLYSNGLPVFSYPNAEAAEESVHFALLQKPEMKDVLLVGGGVSGGCAEVLKYPNTRVDYVEIDPAMIRLAERYLPASGLTALKSPRVRVLFEDGRAFLERTNKVYDAIILSLPEPATAQINRFYTIEFFREARKKLSPAGVLSFIVPSAENYINRDLQQFLKTLDTTLRGVFPEVLAVPGERNVFLASASPLSIDPGTLVASIERLGIRNRFVSPEMLPARLSPLRVDYLDGKIRGRPGLLNRDLVPVSYYFHSILWAAQFKGVESKVLRFFARIPAFWILDVPLVLAGLALAFLALKKRRSPARFLIPVAVVGFTSILVEMAVLIVFQAFFGYVYGKISLLLSAFMAGLFIGSLAGLRRKRPVEMDLAIAQGAFAALLILNLKMVGSRGPEAFPFLALLAVGALSGYIFVAANRLFLIETPHPGIGYGIDLLGSFLGVVLASSFVIPLLGIPVLLRRLAVLNILGLLFALAIASRPSGRPRGSSLP